MLCVSDNIFYKKDYDRLQQSQQDLYSYCGTFTSLANFAQYIDKHLIGVVVVVSKVVIEFFCFHPSHFNHLFILFSFCLAERI